MTIIIFVTSSSLIICLFQSQHIDADANYYDSKVMNNETFLNDTNPESLVAAFSNGMDLSSYTQPKKTDLMISDGNFTMEQLAKLYPDILEKMHSNDSEKIYLIKKTIVIDKDAALNIIDSKVLLKSLPIKDNVPVRIITYGKTDIINSTVISWDPERKRPDFNPYHPRSFLVAKDGGQMNVIGSTISYLGFSHGGIHTLFSSLAALSYYNTSSFTIAESTISYNLHGFYSDETSKFEITGNEIFGNVGYGLDPHTGSADFVIDSNHLFSNGAQAIICSLKCKNVTVINNTVEYNGEGIGLHWLTNSSVVKNNIVKYNKGYGMFIKNSSHNNIIENNTILGNGYGIGLLEKSNENILRSNLLIGNILTKDQIYTDENSQLNLIEDNDFERDH